MKKRIFIMTWYLEIGGVERSLIGLLNALDYSKYEVDLFLYQHGGDFFDMIPKHVNLLPENKKYAAVLSPIKIALKNRCFAIAFSRIWARWKTNIFNKTIQSDKENNSAFHYIANYTKKFLPKISPQKVYDLAISFVPPFYVLDEKVNAKIKIGWVHTDYSNLEIDKKFEYDAWNSTDYIAAVSPLVKDSFSKVFPLLNSKIIVVENILSPNFVRKQAETIDTKSEMPFIANEKKLLSVGRFSHAKNFDNIPDICLRLNKIGVNVKWYIIGYGADETLIRKKIDEAGMHEKVVLLGKKTNPYPYIKACDIYVQPSRYEGKAVTVREAQMLLKPVVITNFSTSGSQLEHEVDGVIISMENNEAVANGLKTFIENEILQAKIIQTLHDRDYGNEEEVEKLYKLINK